MAAPFVISMKATFDGAQAKTGAAEIRREFAGIGQAANQARGPVTNFYRAMEQRSAQGINAALGVRDDFNTAQRRADIEAYGHELDELRAKFNPLFAAEQRFAAVSAEISRAQRLGAITAGEANAAVLREKAAYDALTQSLATNNNARARNQAMTSANSFNSANVAAQFQDILVTSQMGMSPLQIALQQGTQLSAVLGATGAAGAAGVLRSALFSILSPVSLITIGVVGIGAAALQSFGSMIAGADDASDALEEHEKWLDQILTGYDAARQAAKDAATEATRMPRGVVEQELSERQESNTARFNTQLEAIAAKQRELNELTAQWNNLRAESATAFPDDQARLDRFDALIAEADQLSRVQLSANASKAELEGVMELTRRLMAEAREPAVKSLAADLFNLAGQLMTVRAELNSTAAAQREFNATTFRGLGVGDAVEQIRQMTPELRSAREIVNDIFATNAGQARTTSELQGLADAAKEFNAAMDAKDAAEAAEKAQREAQRLAEQKSDYQRAIESIRERTITQEGEAKVIGLSTFAAEKYRMQLELETAARKDAIGLTPERIAQIDQESSAYARAAAEQEALLKVERDRTEQLEFYKSTFRSFFTDAFGNLRKGEEGWKAWANAGISALDRIANRALGMAADGIFDLILGAITGSATTSVGSAFRGGWGSVGLPGNARGTDNWRGGLTRINEEGGEIINLPRGSQVIPHDVSMEMARSSGDGGLVFAPVTNIDATGSTMDEAQFEAILDRRDKAFLEKLPALIRYARNNPRRETLRAG